VTKVLRLFTDGAARGNPGDAGAGIVIEDDQGVRLRGFHRWLGKKTNNEAEYLALIDGLKAVEAWKPDRLEIYLDSQLVVEQMRGAYRIKKPELQDLAKEAQSVVGRFLDVEFKHVEREQNRGADALANKAIDEHLGIKKPGRG
jgi:ribonuclease HI